MFQSPRASISRSILFGVAVGDAIGVPVEFLDRDNLRRDPVTGMRGFGSHGQPAGTWSDDSSLSFCLAEALTLDFNIDNVSQNFQLWLYNSYWTPHGSVFDVGIATRHAIGRLKSGTRPDIAGGFFEEDNGNGSLMRILPLLLHIRNKPIAERFSITRAVSSITHGHIRSVIACFYYLEFAKMLAEGVEKALTYRKVQELISSYLGSISTNQEEVVFFHRLLSEDIIQVPEKDIYSSGYVLHTLEASVWCLLTTDTYSDAVLKAVNLGHDTDTTAAVTGGLAGILYGYESIPDQWINQLARHEDITDLAERLEKNSFVTC